MDLMKPRVMMNGHHLIQQLRMQTDATGICAVVSFFVFGCLDSCHFCNMIPFVCYQESFYSHGLIWGFTFFCFMAVQGFVQNTSWLALTCKNKTNITSFSVHSHFHVSNITPLQLNTNISVHSHFHIKVCTHMKFRLLIMHEAFVAKDACEDKSRPLRLGQAECFHCRNCWWCCNQKTTRCKLCGTRECDDCIN